MRKETQRNKIKKSSEPSSAIYLSQTPATEELFDAHLVRKASYLFVGLFVLLFIMGALIPIKDTITVQGEIEIDSTSTSHPFIATVKISPDNMGYFKSDKEVWLKINSAKDSLIKGNLYYISPKIIKDTAKADQP